MRQFGLRARRGKAERIKPERGARPLVTPGETVLIALVLVLTVPAGIAAGIAAEAILAWAFGPQPLAHLHTAPGRIDTMGWR